MVSIAVVIVLIIERSGSLIRIPLLSVSTILLGYVGDELSEFVVGIEMSFGHSMFELHLIFIGSSVY